jgi:hypothetical protein
MTHVKLRFVAFLAAALALLPLGARAFCYSYPPQPIYEFVNDFTGRYVLLWDTAEIATIDAGSAQTRWHRTGKVFGGVSIFYACGFSGQRMCRFYAPSINAHFLTARPNECDVLRSNPRLGWIFERNDVYVFVPDARGNCFDGQPVFRLYNGRDISHRHTADPSTRASLLAQGWIDEGIAFCSVDWKPRQQIVEYVNDYSGHYVLLWNPAEIAGIDATSAKTGWRRTGYVFGGFNEVFPGFRLCRFYAPSINSHFLTAGQVECDGLRAVPESGWIYERNDVSVYIPDAAGQCETGRTPVHRFHSDARTASGVGYRYTADPSIRASLLAQGWTDEGVDFCAEPYWAPGAGPF